MEPPDPVVAVSLGGSQQLTCRLACAGHRTPSVQWRGLDTSLGAVRSDAGSSVLSVRNASLSAAGTRVCVGSCGTHTFQRTVQLLVFGELPPLPATCARLATQQPCLTSVPRPPFPGSLPRLPTLPSAQRLRQRPPSRSAIHSLLSSSPSPYLTSTLSALDPSPVLDILDTQAVASGSSPDPRHQQSPLTPWPHPQAPSSGPNTDPVGLAHPAHTLCPQHSQTS